MDKSKIKTFLIHSFAFYGGVQPFVDIYFHSIWRASDEERFWESHPFESTLEKADDLCEIGYIFQRNEIIYKKISEKGWIAEILIPDNGEFEIGCELKIENYITKKLVKRLGRLRGATIKNLIHIKYTRQKVNALQVFIKTAAVRGIGLVWVNFTIEAFKFARHIVSTSPEEKTWNPITKAVCGHCQERYDDDEYPLIHDTHLCEACR